LKLIDERKRELQIWLPNRKEELATEKYSSGGLLFDRFSPIPIVGNFLELVF
jgi:hypothetical protein